MQPIARRRFLELTVVSAGAVFGPVACGSNGPEIGLDPAQVFPQSVASGDPRPTSVVLWTRVVDSDRATEDLSLSLEVAQDSAFTMLVPLDGAASRKLIAKAEFDHCVKTRLEGLAPGTQYYYRFRYTSAGRSGTSNTGRTKTA